MSQFEASLALLMIIIIIGMVATLVVIIGGKDLAQILSVIRKDIIVKAKAINAIPEKSIVYKMSKRCGDLLMGMIAIISFSPILIIFCVLLLITGHKGVFIRRECYGYKGKETHYYVFNIYNNKNKIDAVGDFLWKSGFEMCPIFAMLITGSITTIGLPRLKENLLTEDERYLFNYEKPGLASLSDTLYEEGDGLLTELDRAYLKLRSISLDIKILFYTVIRVLSSKAQ